MAGLVEHVLREGIARLSLRPLAAALGTSDRMLLYYFGSRDRLLVTVLEAVGDQLQAGLAAALPPEPARPADLLRHVWQTLRAPEVEPHLRLYLEVSGLAARGEEPFRSAAAAIAAQWSAWVAERLDVAAEEREGAASAALALVDGLLLLRFVAGPEQAGAAAAWLAARLDGPPGSSTA